MAPSVERWQQVSVWSLVALLLSLTVDFLGLSGARQANPTVLLILGLPLLAFLPGLWRGNRRTYQWLCFAVLPYFLWAVSVASMRGWLSTAALQSALLILLFFAAIETSRRSLPRPPRRKKDASDHA